MKRNPYQIIIRPLTTEKGETDRERRNKYYFEVDPTANKIEIKQAIETIYAHKGIKVKAVQVMNKKPKQRRFRFRRGQTKIWKKAIVSLHPDYKLDLY